MGDWIIEVEPSVLNHSRLVNGLQRPMASEFRGTIHREAIGPRRMAVTGK